MLAYHLTSKDFNDRKLDADSVEELAEKLFNFYKENFNKNISFITWDNLNDYTKNFYRGCVLLINDSLLDMQKVSE